MTKPYFVRAEWDDDASVWVATSDDVPGLVTESATIEELDTKLKTLVPDLLQANSCMPAHGPIYVELLARRITEVQPEPGIVLTQRESMRLMELMENPPPRNAKFLEAQQSYERIKKEADRSAE